MTSTGITSVKANTSYETVAASTSESLSVIPATDTITIKGSKKEVVANLFTKETYNFIVKRDYNQVVNIPISNPLSKPMEFYLTTEGVSEDLAIDFIGKGSSEHPFILLPGEEQEIQLSIHTQDATKKSYEFQINALDSNTRANLGQANVGIAVDFQNVNFAIKELEENPYTLAKTIQITNTGDKISDLSIALPSSLQGKATFDPMIEKMVLSPGQTVTTNIIPDLTAITSDISSEIVATAAGKKVSLPIQFKIPKNRTLYEYSVEDILKKEKDKISSLEIVDSNIVETKEKSTYEFTAQTNEGFQLDQSLEIEMLPADTPKKEFEFNYTEAPDGNIHYTIEGILSAAEVAELRKKYEEENDVFSSQLVFDGSSDAAMAFRYSGVYNPKIGWTVFIDGTATDLVELDIAEKKYKSGDISFGEYVGYSAFKVGKIGWNAFGLTRKDPLTGTGAFIVSELGSKADNWFKKQLGFPDSTNEYLADSLLYFLNDFYGWQCINRKFLENTIEIPNNYISDNNSSNGYVYSRIHRPYTSNYYPEDFTFKVNDTPVYNVNDDTIEGPFSFSFPMNLIRTGKNYLDQLNTHKNKGSYIIETEKKVYIPVPNDKTIPIYIGYNETVEVIESPFEDNIVVSKPDFEVYPEMITVENSPIFENTANKLSIKLFNAGTRGGFTDVQVLDNNQVIYSGNIYVSKLDSNTIPLNWTPSAGNHQIKVIVNQGLEKYEISAKNNTTTKSFTVYPKTTKGPEMINVFPGKKAEQVKYITFDFKDELYKDYSLIKELSLIIDGQPVSPLQYKISNGRGWVSLPQALSNGKHTIELKVVDKFGNQTVEKWETTVEMKQSLIFEGTALTVEEGVTLTLQGRLYLQDENGKQDVSQQATYTAQDTKIAEIINSNRIRGVKQGQTTLVAKYNGLELSIPVTVKQGTSKTYTITIKDMQRMGSSSVDVCGIAANSNYCSYLSYNQNFNYTNNGLTVTLTVKQEDLKRFNTVKGVLSIDNKAFIFNLVQEQQLTFSANDFDTKITLPTAAKFNSAQLDILNNGKEEGTIRFYSETDEIYVPSGVYNLSATVSQNNLLMALTKNNFTVKKGDNKLTIDTGNFVSLKTNSKIKPESISLNNRQTGAYLSAPFKDSIQLEKGKYDVNLTLRDSKFSYNVGNCISQVKIEPFIN